MVAPTQGHTMTKPSGKPRKHDTTPSAEALRQQLIVAKDEIARLRPKTLSDQALEDALGKRVTQPKRFITLLERIARALITGTEAADPIQAHNYSPTGTRTRGDDHPIPGAATAGARSAVNKLWDALYEAANTFETAQSRGYYQPEPPRKPKCWKRDCKARGFGQDLDAEFCKGCGEPISTAPLQSQETPDETESVL